MKIGLMRHYKVLINTTKNWMSSHDFSEWVKQYDQSDIDLSNPIRANLNWDVCYTSDMQRAIKTAETIHYGELITTNQLREIQINPMFHANVKLHLNIWLILGRMGWLINHHSQENKYLTRMRAKTLLNTVEENCKNDENVLIVTHGAFMTVLRQELLHRGYIGDTFTKPKNGWIYTFEKGR
ncbi:histidine phosphatase family protein [Paenibacillus guangzhouensis]|uniref:histidine phosphatase family protein n=1 Tax=Paenibacillus guangzhouensis TaxID=1473112 RepID=UPI0012668BC9|nr:histidine phosphatase family protein [Paenibacillus guangzhouensis]